MNRPKRYNIPTTSPLEQTRTNRPSSERPATSHDGSPAVREVVQQDGRPLDSQTRSVMQSRFNHDFSRVRVHTDQQAADSAAGINAMAYTVGDNIVFGRGQYTPETLPGQWLLAHELTHVVQQSGAPPGVQAMSIEPTGTLAEREADRAASAALLGRQVPTITTHSPATIHRTVAGGIFGGLVGAGVGIALGSLLGPVGMIIGGLLGAVAGLAIGDILSSEERSLTDDERREAHIVYGNGLNYDRVKLTEAPIMSIGNMARTPRNTIYFPPGTFSEPFDQYMPWLIHELGHVWQTQHGISVIEKLFWALHGKSAYDYGGDEGLRSAINQGKHFTDFNTEQQADICRNYYRAVKAGRDTSLFDPFIAEVQAGHSLNRPAPAESSAPAA